MSDTHYPKIAGQDVEAHKRLAAAHLALQIKVERLEKQLAALRAEKHCAICGRVLDTPNPLAAELIALRSKVAEAEEIELPTIHPNRSPDWRQGYAAAEFDFRAALHSTGESDD